MGLNIGGICIDRNLQNNEQLLGEILGVKIEFSNTFTLEEAMDDWPNESCIDVLYLENGTFIMCDVDYCVSPYPIESATTLAFVHVETSMSFTLNYSKNAKDIRELTEHNGDIMDNYGEPLEDEKDITDASSLIFKLFEKIVGEDFWSIQPEAEVQRYTILSHVDYFEIKTEEPLEQHEQINEDQTIEQRAEQQIQEAQIEREIDKMDVTAVVSAGLFQKIYSDEEKIEFFFRCVAYCQQRKINAFLLPITFQNTDCIVMLNLTNVRDLILNHPEICKEIGNRMNFEDFQWLARFSDGALDNKKRNETLRKLMQIKTPYYKVPQSDIPSAHKWWKFWE